MFGRVFYNYPRLWEFSGSYNTHIRQAQRQQRFEKYNSGVESEMRGLPIQEPTPYNNGTTN